MPLTAMENHHSPVDEPAAKLHKPETGAGAGDAVAEQNEHQAHVDELVLKNVEQGIFAERVETLGSFPQAGGIRVRAHSRVCRGGRS